jgi:hypothetical protein
MERPVIRMFTSDLGTVRWETTISGTDGLEFRVCGPEKWGVSSLFPDPMALVQYQSEYERYLIDSGFSVSLVNERRTSPDRRRKPRATGERRR